MIYNFECKQRLFFFIKREKLRKEKLLTKKSEETEKKEVPQNLVKQILEQQKEIENIQQSANEYSYD